MTDDQFMQLFKLIHEVKTDLDSKADKADTHRIITMLDGIAKRMDNDDGERAAMNRQLERHERWSQQLADKSGVALSYEP